MTVFTSKERLVFQFLIISIFIGLSIGIIKRTFFQPDFSEHVEKELNDFYQKSEEIAGASFEKSEKTPTKTGDIKGDISVKLLDLNSASKSDLLSLPKIGPVTAERIIRYREDFGPFITEEDLLKIKGIGPKTLDQLKPLIQIK